jgi:hypothetical protein
VRGNPGYGKNDFTDNGDSTITDRATGLMWAKGDSRGKMNWQEALAWAQAKNAARYLGRGDWRLPDAKELQSIVDYTRSPDKTQSAAIDPSFLCTTITNEAGQSDYPNFWTSTTHGAFNGMGAAAIYISFGRGLGYMNGSWVDVHGAGCQRSDPKAGNPADFPYGRGPQGDAIRIYNYVRLVRTAQPATGLHGETGPAVRSFALGPSYPNPVSATARIRFAVPSRERVALRMYDMLGRMVRVLFEGEAGPGAQEIIFRPENLRNGVYLCELRCESGISRRNIILQR